MSVAIRTCGSPSPSYSISVQDADGSAVTSGSERSAFPVRLARALPGALAVVSSAARRDERKRSTTSASRASIVLRLHHRIPPLTRLRRTGPNRAAPFVGTVKRRWQALPRRQTGAKNGANAEQRAGRCCVLAARAAGGPDRRRGAPARRRAAALAARAPALARQRGDLARAFDRGGLGCRAAEHDRCRPERPPVEDPEAPRGRGHRMRRS